jgi:N-dimethylarginine dimethylaminohydrolase
MGDAIWSRDRSILFGGHGFRTSPKVYGPIQEFVQKEVRLLQLVSEDFYHLDTCMVILNNDCVAVVKEAFDEESFQVIQDSFSEVLLINHREAKEKFAGNAYSPDGKHVFVEEGADEFCASLLSKGFTPVSVNTSEFIKSGGSVFCMKLELS